MRSKKRRIQRQHIVLKGFFIILLGLFAVLPSGNLSALPGGSGGGTNSVGGLGGLSGGNGLNIGQLTQGLQGALPQQLQGALQGISGLGNAQNHRVTLVKFLQNPAVSPRHWEIFWAAAQMLHKWQV